jgi:hypothetical protein
MSITKSVEDLLIDRYKVIAPWPEMERWLARVGDILTDNGKTAVKNQDGDAVPVFEWETFPHLFKKLEWYEDREPSEMPQYVKLYRAYGPNPHYHHIHVDGENVKWNFMGDKCISIVHKNGGHNTIEILEPSTETEYLNYINTQKNPT